MLQLYKLKHIQHACLVVMFFYWCFPPYDREVHDGYEERKKNYNLQLLLAACHTESPAYEQRPQVSSSFAATANIKLHFNLQFYNH